jgi:predicted  nucleic acid-binding Zn-ribbon protein
MVTQSEFDDLNDKYEQTKNDLAATQAELASAQDAAEATKTSLEAQIATLTTQKTELEAQLAIKQSELDTKTSELDAKITELAAALAANEPLETQLADKAAELTAALADLAAALEASGAKDTTITGLNAQITGLNGQLTAKADELAAKVEELETASTTLATRNTQIAAIATQLGVANTPSAITAKITELSDGLTGANAQIAAIAVQLGVANTPTAITAKITSIGNEITSLTSQVSTLTGQVETLTGEKTALTNSLSAANTQISGIATQLGAENNSGAITAKIADLLAKADQLTAKIAELATANGHISEIAALVGNAGDDVTTIKANINTLKLALANVTTERNTLQDQLAAANTQLAFVTRQLDVMQAGGTYHNAAWFTQHDTAIDALKTAKSASKTVDVVLFGDQVFDDFDDAANNIYSGTNQYDDFVASLSTKAPNPVAPIVVNFAIAGNTAADVMWQVNQVLALSAAERPNMRYAVVNAGGNDLKNAGSTQSVELGSISTGVVAQKVRGIVSHLKTEIGSTTLVGVLSPVYRGDLNDNDQIILRDRVIDTTFYTNDAKPAPDYARDSYTNIKSTQDDRFIDPTTKTELSSMGYFAINASLKNIMNNIGSALVMAPKSTLIQDYWTQSARYLAKGLDPRQHVMGA